MSKPAQTAVDARETALDPETVLQDAITAGASRLEAL